MPFLIMSAVGLVMLISRAVFNFPPETALFNFNAAWAGYESVALLLTTVGFVGAAIRWCLVLSARNGEHR